MIYELISIKWPLNTLTVGQNTLNKNLGPTGMKKDLRTHSPPLILKLVIVYLRSALNTVRPGKAKLYMFSSKSIMIDFGSGWSLVRSQAITQMILI